MYSLNYVSDTMTITFILSQKMEKIKHNNILYYKIKDFKDYYISKCGEVLSNKNNKYFIMKPRESKLGYLKINLVCNFKKYKTQYIHRLVAITHIPRNSEKLELNHKDSNKLNNSIENLEWCTRSENIKHCINKGGYRNMLGKKGLLSPIRKPVAQYDLNNNLIKNWSYMKEVELGGFSLQCVSSCCRGKTKTHKNYIWKYI